MEAEGEDGSLVLKLGDFVRHPTPNKPFDMVLFGVKVAATEKEERRADRRLGKQERTTRKEETCKKKLMKGATAFDLGVPCSSQKESLDLSLRLWVGLNDNADDPPPPPPPPPPMLSQHSWDWERESPLDLTLQLSVGLNNNVNDHPSDPPPCSPPPPPPVVVSNGKKKRSFSSTFDHGTLSLEPTKKRGAHSDPTSVQPLQCVAPANHDHRATTLVGNSGRRVNQSAASKASRCNSPRPPLTPEESVLKRYVKEVGGSELELVIQKELTATDVNPTQCRLSIPRAMMKAPDFLTPEEKAYLELRNPRTRALLSIPVTLLQPNLESIAINLKKWDMRKESGKVSSSYVLVTAWNQVVKANSLQEGHFIQLWSFRRGKELCLALAAQGLTVLH